MLSTLTVGVMLDRELPTPPAVVLTPNRTKIKHQLCLAKALQISIKFDYLMVTWA